MSRHNPNQSLADCLERIERAQPIVERNGFEVIDANFVLTDALLHNLLIASEVMTRLKNEWPERYAKLELTYPDTNWYAFRRFGDVIRHGYEIVDLAVVRRNLDDMVIAVKKAIQRDLALSRVLPGDGMPDV